MCVGVLAEDSLEHTPLLLAGKALGGGQSFGAGPFVHPSFIESRPSQGWLVAQPAKTSRTNSNTFTRKSSL
jgi:hypothetical protein